MCEPVSATIAATAVAGALIQRSASRRAEANQSEAITKQDQAQKKADDAAAAIGPAAKSINLADEASGYNDLKRNKVAMQQGIMGTMKTNPLSQTTAATQKTTLGT